MPGPVGTHYPVGATGVMLSEVVASSGATLVDEDGDATDWIELHNPTEGLARLPCRAGNG